MRRDVLVDAALWRRTAAWDRHALRARAVMASLDPTGDKPLALSHHSALAVHGLALYGVATTCTWSAPTEPGATAPAVCMSTPPFRPTTSPPPSD